MALFLEVTAIAAVAIGVVIAWRWKARPGERLGPSVGVLGDFDDSDEMIEKLKEPPAKTDLKLHG